MLKEDETDLNESDVTAQKIGYVLHKRRIKKLKRERNRGANYWEVTQTALDAWARAYGLGSILHDAPMGDAELHTSARVSAPSANEGEREVFWLRPWPARPSWQPRCRGRAAAAGGGAPGAMPAWLQAALVEHRTEVLALLEPKVGAGESLLAVSTPNENCPVTPDERAKPPFGVILSGSTPSASPCSEDSEESCLVKHEDSSLEVRGRGSWLANPLRVTLAAQEAHCRHAKVGTGRAIRIPLDDLVYGDFLARHKLRIVGGTAYPDGRTYRPTIYLADDAG
jgi:hypothetical protein